MQKAFTCYNYQGEKTLENFINEKTEEGYTFQNCYDISVGDEPRNSRFLIVFEDNTAEKKKPKPKAKDDVKHRYGEFGHVMLTDNERGKLADLTGDVDKWIIKLDEYIENTHKKYQNHYLTIRNWYNKDTTAKKQETDIFSEVTF